MLPNIKKEIKLDTKMEDLLPEGTHNPEYDENVLLVITVIRFPAKFNHFNPEYVFRLSSLMANKRL